MANKKKRIILSLLALLLLGVLIYSTVRLLETYRNYRQEEEAHSALLRYKPAQSPGSAPVVSSPAAAIASYEPDHETESNRSAEDESASADEPDPRSTTDTAIVNQSIAELKSEHPNALGWISVPGTQVDYPFVQGKDNDFFLHRDLDGNQLYAGIPFLDYRCPRDLSGVNTIFYAHNMRNGSMFGELDNFRYKPFFDQNRDIYVYLEDRTIHAEIVACLVIDPAEKDYLYALQPKADHLSKLLADARCAKRIAPSPEQRFITLSTCGFEFDDARILIVGIIDTDESSFASKE